jgi:hypothetical protein
MSVRIRPFDPVLFGFVFILPLVALLVASGCGGNPSPTAPPPSCTFVVGQTTTAFGATGGTASVSVSAGSGCAWTAVSSVSFISIAQGATGSGNGTVSFTVASNTGGQRTGTLTVDGTAITITQSGATVTPPALSAPTPKSPVGGQTTTTLTPPLEATNSTITGDAGAVTYRFEVSELESFQEGSRTSAQDGIAQGSGTTTWQFTRNLVSNLLYYWRVRSTNGTITSDWSSVATFRTPCVYTLSTLNVAIPPSGGSGSVVVTTVDTCAWSAVSNATFLTVTSGAGATGSGTVMFMASANTGAARSATLTIAGQTVTVAQDAP